MIEDLVADSIDDLLGPAKDRFFGSHYRHARQSAVFQFEQLDAGRWSASALAEVRYPTPHWGVRNGEPRIPHLSTVDVISFLDLLGTRFLGGVRGFDAAHLDGRFSLSKVDLRSGAVPDEDLVHLPLASELTRHGPQLSARTSIGRMHTSSEYDLAAGDASISDILTPQLPMVSIINVHLGLAARTGTADIWLDMSDTPLPDAAKFTLNAVIGAQLLQALIATLSGVPREASDTLWMRKYRGSLARGDDLAAVSVATVTIDRQVDVRVGDHTFRTFEGSVDATSVRSRFAIAHALTALSDQDD